MLTHAEVDRRFAILVAHLAAGDTTGRSAASDANPRSPDVSRLRLFTALVVIAGAALAVAVQQRYGWWPAALWALYAIPLLGFLAASVPRRRRPGRTAVEAEPGPPERSGQAEPAERAGRTEPAA